MSNEKYKTSLPITHEDVQRGETSQAKILQMVLPRSTVLECGPAYGSMTRYLKEKLDCTVYIVEADAESFAHTVQFADGGVCADLEDDAWMEQLPRGAFDYVTYVDVLEHLRDPREVLKKMRRFLKPNGSVLVSVPNVAYGDIILNLLCDRFTYTQTGLLDNTHIHLFAREDLRAMIRAAGYYLAYETYARVPLRCSEQGAFLAEEEYQKLRSAVMDDPAKEIYQFICQLTQTEVAKRSDIDRLLAAGREGPCRTQVFFDTGDGFHENQSRLFSHPYNQDFAFNIPVEQDICALRVDPADKPVLVTVKKCCGVSGEGIYDLPLETNGFLFGNAYMFDTSDPQLLFPAWKKGIREVRMILNVISITAEAAENCVYQKYQEEEKRQEERDAAIRRHEEEIVKLQESSRQELEEERERSGRLLAQLWEESRLTLKEEQMCSEQALGQMEERFRLELKEKQEDFAQQIQKMRADVEASLELLSNQKADVERELAACRGDYAAAAAQRDGLRYDLAQVQSAYQEISNAFFWKITKPIRGILDAIKSALRKNRYTYLFCRGLKCWKENGFLYTWNNIQNKLHYRQDFVHVLPPLFTKEELDRQRLDTFSHKIRFSVLVPLYNTPEQFLHEMIRSVLDQTYKNWELCLADGSDNQHWKVGKICRKYARRDSRVKYEKLRQNKGISENTNACIEMAGGDFLVLLDHDDLLHPAALHEVMKAICEQDADFVYTDENTFHNRPADAYCPHFKPDYSPDTLRSYNYICHLTSFSRELLREAGGGFRAKLDGSQDYDMILRLTEKAVHIEHIPEILYYWRSHDSSTASDISAKPYVVDTAKKALAEHLIRMKLSGEVLDSSIPSTYRIQYNIKEKPLVSILIPNKDHMNDLQKCIGSIRKRTTYPAWEIIIIENGSTDRKTFTGYSTLKADIRIKIVSWDGGFNYSAINNFGAKYADGQHLILLNNDIEVITPNWIEQMLMFSQREDVGAVGPMLYYPDGTVQHAGVVVGLGGVAGHAHKHFAKGHPGYMYRMTLAQNFSAVTGACMMIRRNVWDKVGGLDEDFQVAFNDVDLCMRICQAGYRIVWTPYAELYHYESKSRGMEDTPEKQRRFMGEIQRFKDRWREELKAGDPCYNPNLTLDREDFSLK